jgi:hypothetical protein
MNTSNCALSGQPACPACAAREGPGAAVLGLVGALIAVPYLIAAVTIRVVRRLERGP